MKCCVFLLFAASLASATDREATRYVEVLGQRLAYASPVPVHVRFVVTSDGPRYVTSAPDGAVRVPSNLFESARDEAEFAAAIARAIAHVALAHTGADPTSGLFTRSLESEADRASAVILAGTGFDPEAVVRYIRNADASFDTSEKRVEAVLAELNRMERRVYGPDSSPQFEALKARFTRARLL